MKKVVILHSAVPPGAPEDELDCLRQAETIAEALIRIHYKPVLLPFGPCLNDTLERLKTINPWVVFNIVETFLSSGRLIYFSPAVLDVLRIPYTGCKTRAVFLTSNKPLAKQILWLHGIATPNWMEHDGSGSCRKVSGAYLIKSSWEHASIGLDESSLIRPANKTRVKREMENRKERLGGACYAECFVDGREFNIALMAGEKGIRVLPVAEMLFQDYAEDKLKIVDYKAKWDVNSFEYHHTVRRFHFSRDDFPLLALLRKISLQCWKIFSLSGYARVDFRVDRSGKPWVLEINTNPCLSPDAGFAAALERAGIEYHEAIRLILKDALR